MRRLVQLTAEQYNAQGRTLRHVDIDVTQTDDGDVHLHIGGRNYFVGAAQWRQVVQALRDEA